MKLSALSVLVVKSIYVAPSVLSAHWHHANLPAGRQGTDSTELFITIEKLFLYNHQRLVYFIAKMLRIGSGEFIMQL